MGGRLVTVEYSKKYGYYLLFGRETFYDDDNNWITFDDPESAVDWLIENHGDRFQLIENEFTAPGRSESDKIISEIRERPAAADDRQMSFDRNI